MTTRLLVPTLAACALALAACGESPPDTTATASQHGDADGAPTMAAASADALGPDGEPLEEIFGATEIPYPVYPNGSKYRVGGENGLRIVVFQTEDTFEEVDSFFQERTEEAGMPRLMAMNDYVRYSRSATDEDPWATYRPGIVIHEFDGEDERRAVGAKDTARTNIIMSF